MATMNNGTSQASRRPSVSTPYSTRTISHPTFMSICQESLQRWSPACPPVPVMTPLDFYYTDPNLPPGHRVPNIVTKFEAIERFQLNTPPPIMSSQQAPSIQPDPFLSGNHPIRNLGTRSWAIDLCNRPHPYMSRPQTKGTLEVIQMSPAEDEAITSLLLLHHSSGAKSQRGSVQRSPTPGCRVMAQGPQSPGQSSSAKVCAQSQDTAVSARSARAPETSSLNGITTVNTPVNAPFPQKDYLCPGRVSFSGPPESHAQLQPGSPEPSPELKCLPEMSPGKEVHGHLFESGI